MPEYAANRMGIFAITCAPLSDDESDGDLQHDDDDDDDDGDGMTAMTMATMTMTKMTVMMTTMTTKCTTSMLGGRR